MTFDPGSESRPSGSAPHPPVNHSHKTCLITGGAGFIGTRLAERLRSEFARVVVLDALIEQVHGAVVAEPEGEFIHAFLQDEASYAWLANVKPDVVVHLAAETGTAQSMSHGALHASSNVLGTAVLLDALRAFDAIPEQLVLASSRAVYGEGGYRDADADGHSIYPGLRSHRQLAAGEWDFAGLSPLPMAADRIEPRPASIYGATKLAQEHLATAWSAAVGSRMSILRLQNVYGPGQSPTNPYTGILPLFFRTAADGRSIPVYEDGRMTRDFVHVDDVVAALSAAIDGRARAIWDVGSGVSTSILELAQHISGLVQGPAPQITGRFREGDIRHAVADIGCIARDAGWTAAIPLEAGLPDLAQWLESVGELHGVVGVQA